ncbi:hypothetical protein FRC18_010586 [Serendipita sp. 400]|nr:hypothetical protein FRC18_010586 [Serendipita sp. 400]
MSTTEDLKVIEQSPEAQLDDLPTVENRPQPHKKAYWAALGTVYWALFVFGINDGSLGPMIPAYQRYYQVGYTTVALIFVLSSTGAVLASIANVWLSGRINFSKLLVLSALCQITAYTILSTGPPFPLVCVAYFILGCGLALLNAHANGFLSMLKNPSVMGVGHAIYGAGALVSPLIATQFAQFTGRRWAYFYSILLFGVIVNLTLYVVVFRGKEYDEILSEIGVVATETTAGEVNSTPHISSDVEGPRSDDPIAPPSFASIMKQPSIHLMALFAFVYVGAEVTLGGWIVTFIIRERHGGPSSGYVSTGFFGGLTLGRVALLWVNKTIGERRVIFIYTLIGIALDITIWFTPSLIGNAIAVSFIGMALGPMYPIVMSQAGHVIPQRMLTGSIGWISGFGCAGAAVIPFVTGALAGRWGIQALQPFILILMSIMGVLWFFVPAAPKR